MHAGRLAPWEAPGSGRAARGALVHYEIGVRIGELSLPADFDGLLVWARVDNRAFLRCMHGYGLCLWRLGDFAAAKTVFERILSFNPNDNQGVRFCSSGASNPHRPPGDAHPIA
jgi:hypothetical protein